MSNFPSSSFSTAVTTHIPANQTWILKEPGREVTRERTLWSPSWTMALREPIQIWCKTMWVFAVVRTPSLLGRKGTRGRIIKKGGTTEKCSKQIQQSLYTGPVLYVRDALSVQEAGDNAFNFQVPLMFWLQKADDKVAETPPPTSPATDNNRSSQHLMHAARQHSVAFMEKTVFRTFLNLFCWSLSLCVSFL